MKATITLLTLVLTSQNAFASSYKFDCGKTFNIPRVLEIKPKAPGDDGFTLAATYTTRGVDDTTGTVVAKKLNLVGQTDLSSELTGEEIPVIALSKVNNPNYQVVIAKTQQVGKTVPGAQINIDENDVVELKCTLKSFKK